jgi:hypothetical protein
MKPKVEFDDTPPEVLFVPNGCYFPIFFENDEASVFCHACNRGIQITRPDPTMGMDAVIVANRILDFTKEHSPCPYPPFTQIKLTL